MKRADLTQIKGLSTKELAGKAKDLRKEIADLIIDKNINKLKDTKVVFKKRKDLAQILTVLRQKQILERLESEISKQSGNEKKARTGQSSNVSKSVQGDRKGLSK